MATRNSLDERINKIDLKTKMLMAQARILKAKKAEQDRKERTRRLIQIGAIVEKVFNEEITNLKELENKLAQIKMASDEFTKMKKE